eukprot:Lithocolla_globosa_v1_NODE_4378_length_1450_cov_119.556272.p2 type:complete len:116 gc:universal NODE_4378_length_1450_cov_119.556272:1004-1351(+)
MEGLRVFIPRRSTCMDWIVLLQMISRYDSRSDSLYPPWWRIFICFRMVLFPDSPAPNSKSFTSLLNRDLSLLIFLSISLLVPSLPLPPVQTFPIERQSLQVSPQNSKVKRQPQTC